MSILTWRTTDEGVMGSDGRGLYDVSNGGHTVRKARSNDTIYTIRTKETLPAIFSIEVTVDQVSQKDEYDGIGLCSQLTDHISGDAESLGFFPSTKQLMLGGNTGKSVHTFSSELKVGSKITFVCDGSVVIVSIDGETTSLKAPEFCSSSTWFAIATRKVGWQFSLSSSGSLKEGILPPISTVPMSILTWRTTDEGVKGSDGRGLYDVSNGGHTVRKAREDGTIYTIRTKETLPSIFSIEVTVDQVSQKDEYDGIGLCSQLTDHISGDAESLGFFPSTKKLMLGGNAGKTVHTFSSELKVGSKITFVCDGNVVNVSVDGETTSLKAPEFCSSSMWFAIATRKVGWQFTLSSSRATLHEESMKTLSEVPKAHAKLTEDFATKADLKAVEQQLAGILKQKAELEQVTQCVQALRHEILEVVKRKANSELVESGLQEIRQELAKVAGLKAVIEEDREQALKQVQAVRSELANTIAEAFKSEAVAGIKDLQSTIERLDKKPSFFTLAKTVDVPELAQDVEEALTTFVKAFGKKYRARSDDIDRFIEEHTSTASVKLKPPHASKLGDIQWMGARLWTADHQLEIRQPDGIRRDMGLFTMLAKINREDDARLLLSGGMALQKAINLHVVNRHGQACFPDTWDLRVENESYRGANIDAGELAFWRDLMSKPEEERKYRIPALLASSVDERTASSFLRNPPPLPNLVPVLFVLKWVAADPPCLHARYIEGESAVSGEKELLLAGFSAVQLLDLKEAEGTEPLTITIRILRDNRAEPEHLPLSTWA